MVPKAEDLARSQTDLPVEATNAQAAIPEFEEAYGEPFQKTLDLSTWTLGENLSDTYDKLEKEIADATEQSRRSRKPVREVLFSRIKEIPFAPKNAGIYQARTSDLEKIHRGLLFNGGVEACDGTSVVHDTIPLTITQIGVCLVSYNGQQGSWAHRLYRRDLRSRITDPVEEVMTLLERRERRERIGQDDEQQGEQVNELARRGIMAYAERAILKEKSFAQWRMGHGNPAPYELLTGKWASYNERIKLPMDLIRWYVNYKKFIFVPSAPRQRHWLMIGDALKPLEFAIIQTLQPYLESLLKGHYREVRSTMEQFCQEVGPEIVVGVYRVWDAAPPYLFYAHKDFAEMAAHIAMADSILQEYRGFPMLIDLADTVCSTTFGVNTFIGSVQTAYADAGEPFRFLGERETRSK